MRFSLFCGITKPKLRKIGRKCKCAYILPRGGGRGAAEVRKRGGKTGPQLAVPAVCDGGRQPAERPHEASAQWRASAAPRLRPARLNRAATRKEYSEMKMKTKIEKQPHLARFCHELRCTPSHPVALRRTPPRTPPQCTCGGGFKNSNLYNGIRGFVLKRKASNPSLVKKLAATR